MIKRILTLIFFSTSITLFSQALTGVQQIGNGKTYTTITSAISDLVQKGINGNVYFDIYFSANTKYVEQIVLPNFNKGPNDTVFFRSAELPSKIDVEFASSQSNTNYVLNIDEAQNVVFEDISFTATGSTMSGIVKFTGSGQDPQNILFKNCDFIAPTGSGPYRELCYNSCSIHNIFFINDTFTGGDMGIYFTSASTYQNNIVVEKSTFSNQFSSSVYMSKINNIAIHENNMIGNNCAYGIHLSDMQNNITIHSNFINTLQTIFLQNASAGCNLQVFNNRFISNNYLYSVFLSQLQSIEFIHNTLVEKSGINVSLININACSNGPFIFKNNILINNLSQTGNIYSFDNTIGSITKEFDHNAYHTTGNIGYNGQNSTPYNNLTSWRSFSDDEANSFNGPEVSLPYQPSWFTNDYHINCHLPKIFRAAVYLNQQYEIDGDMQKRNFYPAWMGAVEVKPYVGDLTNIDGYVYSGSNVIGNGKAILMADISNRALLDTVSITNINNDGSFGFSNMHSKDYTLLVVPDANIYPNKIPTYYGGRFNWTTYFPVSADTCSNGLNLFVQVDSLENSNSGTGVISGYVTYDVFANKTSDPIPGIDVVLDKIPPSKSVKITTTGNDGYYQFDYLENGDYQVKIDFPGLINDSLFYVTVDNNTNQYSLMDYCVDTAKITMVCGSNVSVSKIIKEQNNHFYIAPNPFQNELTIYANTSFSTNENISISDISGRILRQEKVSGNKSVQLDMSGFESGIYIIQIQNNETKENYKVIKE